MARYLFTYGRKTERTIPGGDKIVLLSAPRLGATPNRFREEDFRLASLFDGVRSVEEVQDAFAKQVGHQILRADIDAFVEQLLGLGLLTEASPGAPGASAPGAVPPASPAMVPPPPPPPAAAPAASSPPRPAPRSPAPPPPDIPGDEPRARRGAQRPGGGDEPQGRRPVALALPAGGFAPRLGIVAAALTSRTGAILVLLSVAASIFGVWRNWHELGPDLYRLAISPYVALVIVCALALVNVVAETIHAGAIYRFAGAVPDFGIGFFLRIIPVLRTDSALFRTVQERKARGRIIASSLLAKMLLFVLAIATYISSRGHGHFLPQLALALGCVTGIAQFISLNPLIEREGYFLLTNRFGAQALRERAVMSWLGFSDKLLADRLGVRTVPAWLLRLYGVLSLAFLCFVSISLGQLLSGWLHAHWGGLGVLIFVVFAAVLIVPPARKIFKVRKALQATRAAPFARQRRLAAMRQQQESEGFSLSARVKLALLVMFGLAMFLPYPYETGGNFELLPPQRQEIPAQTSGAVVEVRVNTGDWVEKGEVIARLDSHDQEQNLASTRDLLNKQVAAVDRARSQSQFSSRELVRKAKMHEQQLLSDQDYDNAVKQADSDVLEVKAAEAELSRLKQQVQYYETELERTNIRMPFAGRLITPLLNQKTGHYLTEGAVFAIAENTVTIQAQVSVPEWDVGEIAIGAQVRLKVWAYPTQIFTGKIVSIDPAVESESYGRVVNVLSDVPNQDFVLKSGMTGYAKIEVGDKFVIVAFTRMIVRFVLIELWSWIP